LSFTKGSNPNRFAAPPSKQLIQGAPDMKTLTLLTSMILCATAAQAQTRLESEYKRIAAIAMDVDKQKAEEKAARAKAEEIRIRTEKEQQMQQEMNTKLAVVSSKLQAQFQVTETQTIQTNVRHLEFPDVKIKYHYILKVSQYSNASNDLICQMGVIEKSTDGLLESWSKFFIPVTCASEKNGTSELTFISTGKGAVDLVTSFSKPAFDSMIVFQGLEAMDASLDQAKADGFTQEAIGRCLATQVANRRVIHYYLTGEQTTDIFNDDPRFPSTRISKAIEERRTSLESFRALAPECFGPVVR